MHSSHPAPHPSQSSSIPSWLSYTLIALPFIIYFIVLNHYIVDIPVWDDYVNPLDMTNKAITASTLKEKLHFLVTPMNGHIPFLPRVLLYIQYLVGVTSPIKTALIVSNLGWMLTALLLVAYCHQQYQISLTYLIPVPFLLLSIIHWEAMDFYSSAFQMYWGSGLFAVVGLIAITTNRPIAASLCFLAGIFCSGGALAAYPVCLLYLLFTRQWKNGLVFLLCTAVIIWIYVYINPPENNLHKFADPLLLVKYILEFSGNLISNGQWDLSPYAQDYLVAGIIIILSMSYLTWKVHGYHAVKLIFLYVIVIGAMAGYARIDIYAHAVSRYAMYSLLSTSCIYILLVAKQKADPTRIGKISVTLVALVSIGIWAHSLFICRIPLQTNHDQRTTAMKNYISSGNPNDLNSWNAQQAKEVLDISREIGLYNFTNALNQ